MLGEFLLQKFSYFFIIMEMKYIIADFLVESADKIRKNECGLQESEIVYLASQIMHVKVNKTQAAEFLHISSRTFDRKICDGELPIGKKDIGSNQLYWYKDELLT